VSARISRFASALVMGVLLGAVILTGCGGGGSDSGGDSKAYVEPKGAATETIAIEAGNFYFKPDKISTAAGIAKIELTAKNIHDLVFDGAYPGFTLEADGGGGTQAKKIDLKPGTYTFYCSITGHRAQGMEGTLTVK